MLPGESQEEFDEFLAGYLDEHQPATPGRRTGDRVRVWVMCGAGEVVKPPLRDREYILSSHPTFPDSSLVREENYMPPGSDARSILREASKRVPAVRFAEAIAGVAAAVSIIAGFRLNWLVAAVGVVVMLALMTVMVIFTRLADKGPPQKTVEFLAWAAVVLTIAVAGLTITTTFAGWPATWSEVVAHTPLAESVSVPGGTLLFPISIVQLIPSSDVHLSDFLPRDLPQSLRSDAWRSLDGKRVSWLCKKATNWQPADETVAKQKLVCSDVIVDVYIGNLSLLANLRSLDRDAVLVVNGRLANPHPPATAPTDIIPLAVPVHLDSIYVIKNWPKPTPPEPDPAQVQAKAEENRRKAAVQDLVTRLKELPDKERPGALRALSDSQVEDLFDQTEWSDFETLILRGLSAPDLARLLWRTLSSIPVIQDSTTLKELMDDPNTFHKKEERNLGFKQNAVVQKLRDLKNNPGS